jgi:hypothetical protein
MPSLLSARATHVRISVLFPLVAKQHCYCVSTVPESQTHDTHMKKENEEMMKREWKRRRKTKGNIIMSSSLDFRIILFRHIHTKTFWYYYIFLVYHSFLTLLVQHVSGYCNPSSGTFIKQFTRLRMASQYVLHWMCSNCSELFYECS